MGEAGLGRARAHFTADRMVEETLAGIFGSQKILPATVSFVDIAGNADERVRDVADTGHRGRCPAEPGSAVAVENYANDNADEYDDDQHERSGLRGAIGERQPDGGEQRPRRRADAGRRVGAPRAIARAPL